jgi:hypothetical protein
VPKKDSRSQAPEKSLSRKLSRDIFSQKNQRKEKG